jgi:hypothetical protein
MDASQLAGCCEALLAGFNRRVTAGALQSGFSEFPRS